MIIIYFKEQVLHIFTGRPVEIKIKLFIRNTLQVKYAFLPLHSLLEEVANEREEKAVI